MGIAAGIAGRQYRLDQNRTPLFDALRKFIHWDPVPFFIPSHKMGEGIDPRFKSFAGENIFKMDLCEVRWTDDFHGATSSIKEAQELAADAWGAARTHFLVNGTSGGIIAAICAVCGEGDRIIVPRNAHKSAIYGLIVSGAAPVYVMPELDEERGLIGGLAPAALEEALGRAGTGTIQGAGSFVSQGPGVDAGGGAKNNANAKAVFTVSPTYHGVMSDTAALAEIAHRHGAVLISDEAHGNHMYFNDRLPKGALECGADIVCQSTHKMSGALTQASMLHLGLDAARRIDFDKVRANLSLIQTTSPSYILLASLDLARSYIATQGRAALDGTLDALEKARRDIGAVPGIEILGDELAGSYGVSEYEPTRLVVSARKCGLDGYRLFDLLRESFGIECEFADPNWCVCVAGLGTTPAHTEALAKALAEIAESVGVASDEAEIRHKGTVPLCPETAAGMKHKGTVPLCPETAAGTKHKGTAPLCPSSLCPPIPPLRMTPREAWFADKETVPFEKARGRLSAEMVVPYPPGIPVLCPGEIVTDEVFCYLDEQRKEGRHMHCIAGDSLETLSVVK